MAALAAARRIQDLTAFTTPVARAVAPSRRAKTCAHRAFDSVRVEGRKRQV
jgi:hypothetical protein